MRLALSTLAVLPLLGVSVSATGQTGTIKFEFVNIRVNPGADQDVSFVLKKGDKVEILSNSDGWLNIKSNKKVGWVKEDAISMQAQSEKANNIKTAPASNKTKIVNNSVLNFRKAASTSSGIISVLKQGDKVKILEEGVSWTKIEFNGNTGYVSTKFLADDNSGGESNSSEIMEVTSTKLTVRKSMNATSEKLFDLKKGDKVQFISSSNGWYKIKFDGKEGYVSSYYVEETGETILNDEETSVDESGTDESSNPPKQSTSGEINYVDMGMTLSSHVDLQLAKSLNVDTQNGGQKVTKDVLTKYMDPNNYSDSEGMMQFAQLNQYTEDLTASQLNSYLNKYCKSGNVFYNQGQAFINAAKKNNVNVLYLVAHSMIETGYGSSALAKGTVYNGKTVYNFFGIGAVDGNALAGGSATAYKNGWTSVAAGIDGAASWIASKYIHNSTYNQNTLYDMKWSTNYTWHQYASDVAWPSKIGKKISEIGSYSSNLGAMNYKVPQYR
ncbi:SH3 domain-containing protein [Peptostreptococcus faecalis]|uniref:SH3 domain-containing protein n=1 Tax=Peptostreptococcus faecalis TaxID=2045015 RepID=UPI001FA8BCD0|nr:SH3 domain-containing protein [Peptostreptococcus faecalis]